MDHTIELAVHAACDHPDVKPLFEKVRNHVRYIRSSPARRKAFKQVQKERLNSTSDREDGADDENHERADIFLPRSAAEYRRARQRILAKQKHPWILILDVAKKWSSTFRMIERFVQLYEDFMVYAVRGGFDDYDEDSCGRVISITEWQTLKSWTDALAPVADFVLIGEEEKCVTMAWICPLFAHVLNCVKPPRLVERQERRFRRILFQSLDQRLGFLLKQPNMALAAAALHPAFSRLTFISEDLREEVWDDLFRCCKEYGQIQDQEIERDSDVEDMDVDMMDPLQQLDNPKISETTAKCLLRELRKRLAKCAKSDISLTDMIRIAATNANFNPLRWWRRAEALGGYQTVIHLPRIIFCTPASSVPSERIFSGIHSLIVLDRTCLAELYCFSFPFGDRWIST